MKHDTKFVEFNKILARNIEDQIKKVLIDSHSLITTYIKY